jgi:hypothetical protein
MDHQARRLVIQGKLLDRTLPYNSIPRVWGGTGHGELCDGCDDVIDKPQLIMEGINPEGRGVQFHVECFYIWDKERRVGGEGGAPLKPSP